MATESQTPQTVPIETQVLDMVRELLIEQGKTRAAQNLTMHSSFMRELGLQSLDMIELVIRCEAKLDMELPDEIAEQADTPAGWVRAIQQGAQEIEAKSAYRIVPPDGKPPEAPHWAKNLVDVLRYHAEASPGRIHIHLLEDGSGHGITCAQLLDAATNVARGLVSYGLKPGDRIAILLPNSADFFHAFYGVLLAGGIPVPLYPPANAERIAEYVAVQAGLLRNVGVRALIGFGAVAAVSRILRAEVPGVEATTVEALHRAGTRAPAKLPEPNEYALIQYTSGSTGDPKAVALTHEGILANIRGIGKALGVRDDDAVVSWLPLGSDMGLVGCWLFSLYYGVPFTQLSPLEFMTRPESWLWAIHDSRGTLSAAPNFAFEHCARRIPVWTLEGIDLSSWRAAVIAGEPVLAETMNRFTQRFAFTGLNPAAMLPCYGLAENSVALNIPPPGRGPVKLAGEAYSVGSPIEGHEVRVVDEAGVEVDDGIEGRLEFRGPCRFAGYWKDEKLARDTREWIDTGDLAVKIGGEIAVTGRVKETILREGRSLAPQYIEAAVDATPGVQAGAITAIGIPDPERGTEKLVLVCESAAESEADFRGVRERVSKAAADAGTPPDEIVLIPVGTLPKTSNGKRRRAAVKEQYRNGTLGTVAAAPWRQMAGLWSRNFGTLAGETARQTLSACWRGWVRFSAGAVGFAGGTLARIPGCAGAVGPTVRTALAILGRSPRLEGTFPKGACVIAANRCSRFDPLALIALAPERIAFCGAEAGTELKRWRKYVLKPWTIRAGEVDSALNQGRAVVLLPDGPVGAPPMRCRFQLQALEAAASSGVPVIPVAVGEIRGRTIVKAGEPVPRKTEARALRDAVRQAITALFR